MCFYYSLQVVFNKRHEKNGLYVVYYFNFLFPLFMWGLFRLWSLLWHCVDLQVGMSIPEEPAVFAFGVERLGTNLSLMQAYMVSQAI